MLRRESEYDGKEKEKVERRSGNYKVMSEKAQTCNVYVDIGIGEI